MFKKKFISKKVLIVKVAHNDPHDSSSQKINQVDSAVLSRTWGSPTCSRRSLSINPNFWKENSLVPRMISLIHPAKILDLVESKSKDIG